MPRRIYFAYGSNLHRAQMQERCPGAVPLRRHVLDGWRLVFRAWADIVPCPGEQVQGALYEVTPDDEAALDRYEVVPDEYVQRAILDADGNELCFFYQMLEAPLCPPEPWYLEVIRQGYRDWGLDEALLEAALRDTAVLSVPGAASLQAPAAGGAASLLHEVAG